MPEKEPKFTPAEIEKKQGEALEMDIAEIFDEKIEKFLNLVADSASEVLKPEVVKERVNNARNSIWIVSEQGWQQLCAENEKFTTDALAFVVSRPRFYGKENKIGKIVIPYQEGMDKDEETVNVILHELMHKLGPETTITCYPEPHHDKEEIGLIYTMQVEHHLGPLKMVLENIIDDKEELTPGVTRQSWHEISNDSHENNRQILGEWRMWEAITDWFAEAFSIRINPHYEFKGGYKERSFIQDLVDDMETKGEREIRKALKEGLFNGSDETFKKLLNKYYGSNAYDKLIEIMFRSESHDTKVKDDFKLFLRGQ